MKTTFSILCCAAATAVFALPPVRPVLPHVAHDDTETVTNVPFAAWQDCAGKFNFSLTCRTTPTNNVQFALGTDADGNGALSLAECGLVVGWDSGAWFVQNGFDGERMECAVGAGDAQTLAVSVRLNPRTAAPVSVAATIDGVAAFAGVSAARFYKSDWNMMRLTGRGLDDSAESPEVCVLPSSLSVIVR